MTYPAFKHWGSRTTPRYKRGQRAAATLFVRAGELLGEPDGHDAEDDENGGHDVDDRGLVQQEKVLVDPDREGLDALADGERGHDDLVEAQCERPNRQPADSEERSIGSVTFRNVRNVLAPRSIEASSRLPPSRRSRATALLNTVTMQNVACDTMSVKKPSLMPIMVVKKFASAMPVTTPGRAIGRMISSETKSRPKNRNRCSARAAMVHSTSATSVATIATCTKTRTTRRARPAEWKAATHHSVVKPVGGHAKVREVLKELITTSASGE